MTTARPARKPPTSGLTWAALGVVMIVPLVVLRVTLRPLDDADAYWHVLSGLNVWHTHQVVVADPLSLFTARPWVQEDWLADLAMAGTFRVGGYAALSWLYAVLGIALFVTIYCACRRRGGVLVSALVAVMAWVGTSASQSQRPQTISFVLLAVTLQAWLRVPGSERRPPWWLIGLTWLWACCHGMWFLGPMVGAVVVVGLALERDRPRRELLRLAAVPALSVIAAALTPVGPRLLALPFTVGGYAGLVSEWRPPDIHEPYVAVTVALLVVTALTWARSPVRVPWYDVLLWTVAVGWTLVYARTVAVGAVVVAPLAAGALQRIASVTATGSPRWERAAVASAAVVAAIGALFLAPSLARGPAGVPSALGSAVDALPRGTVVLNDEALGGWLLLEHPGVAPVVDTRNHLFAPPYVERYVRARAGLDGWESFVTDTGARAALVREGEPLVAALPDRLGWTVVKRADGYVLLAAPAS